MGLEEATTSGSDPIETITDEVVAAAAAGSASTPASSDEGGQTADSEGAASQAAESEDGRIAEATAAPAETDDEKTEDGVSLKGQPEQLRGSYQKLRASRDEIAGELETTKTKLSEVEVELGALKDTPGYLKADAPLDQWDPNPDLEKMETEAKEYHDKLVDTVVEKHLWGKLPDRLVSTYTSGKPLAPEQTESAFKAFDILSRVSTGLGANDLYTLAELYNDPQDSRVRDAAEALFAERGQNPVAPVTGYQAPPGAPSQVGTAPIPTVEQVAEQYNLDPKEPGHRAFIDQHRRDLVQQQKDARERADRAARDKADEDRRKAEAEQATTTRLNTTIDAGWTDAVGKWAKSFTPEQEEVKADLLDIAKAKVERDPNYKTLKERAAGWFKQGEKYETRAARDLGAMQAIVQAKVDEVFQKHLGPRIENANLRTAVQKNNATKQKHVPGGTNPGSPGGAVPAGGTLAERVKARAIERGIFSR